MLYVVHRIAENLAFLGFLKDAGVGLRVGNTHDKEGFPQIPAFVGTSLQLKFSLLRLRSNPVCYHRSYNSDACVGVQKLSYLPFGQLVAPDHDATPAF